MNDSTLSKIGKIGILTFHRSASYGAVLQSYALSTVLKNLFTNYETGIIDFFPPRFFKHRNKKRNQCFYDFADHNLNLLTDEKPVLAECFSALKDPSLPISKIVVGSDQVWNPAITKENMADYFADTIPQGVEKYAYAASFGVADLQSDEAEKTKITAALDGYRKISVREKSAIDICRNFGRSDAVNVIDPTLLAEPGIYMKFIKNTPKQPLLNGFFLSEDSCRINILKQVAGVTDSKVVLIGRKAPFFSFIKSCIAPDVADFLTMLYHSSGIVTDSFHGVCFSIIFQKPFIVLPSHRKERFTRIAELLETLNLTDRVISDYDPARAVKQMQTPIDYGKVGIIIEQWRKESLDFLKTIAE